MYLLRLFCIIHTLVMKTEFFYLDGSCNDKEEENKWLSSTVQANMHLAGITRRTVQYCHDC